MWKYYAIAYFQSFNVQSSLERGCLNGKQCQDKFFNSIEYPYQNIHLNKMLNSVEQRINEIGLKIMDINDLTLLRNIPWKILLFSEGEVLYPHTHGDVIFLPKTMVNNVTSKTLFHEKIHLFQKLFPIQTQKYISGYKVIGKFNLQKYHFRNPDIDLYIYNNNLPVKNMNKFRHDHPLEQMAYNFAEELFKEQA